MKLTKKLMLALFAVLTAVAASAAYWQITDNDETESLPASHQTPLNNVYK